MSIATAPPMSEKGGKPYEILQMETNVTNEPMEEKLSVVEGGSNFRVEVEDRDPNRINEHLQVKIKGKFNARFMPFVLSFSLYDCLLLT